MMPRELFAKVLLAVADCWPIPGRLAFEVTYCAPSGCRLVVTDPGKNYSDTISVSCNFDAASDVRTLVRNMHDMLTSPETTRVRSVRAPRTPRVGMVACLEGRP